ncbi:MAG TPA: TlpA disulfide reductase family protein [Chitinophagales bacterium]|nr:TlpA disulfide reductase family protein [Chitinophagales bacterium]
MQNKLLLLAFLFSAQTLIAQFRIAGNVQNLNDQFVYLHWLNDKLEKQTDSFYCSRGAFVFTGTVAEPTCGNLTSKDNLLERELFFENGTTTITGDITANELMIKGGSATTDFEAFEQLDVPYRMLRDSLGFKAFIEKQGGDTMAWAKTNKEFYAVLDESKKAEYAFLMAHTQSPVSTYLLSQMYVHAGTRTKGDSLMALMTNANQQSKYARYRKQLIDKMMAVEPGHPVKHFSQTDTSGKVISTQQFNDKYYLIDFWASWCGPCRAENPNLLKAYKQYHSKGFEVLAVSLDTDRDKWIAAIVKDAMPWVQVSDLKGWKNEVARLYEIGSIPDNFLVDKKGIIIAKGLRGPDLLAKLQETLGE